MRVRLKGIHTVKATLADGTVRRYYYAWRGGPRLEGKPGSPEFIAGFNAAIAALRAPPPGVLETLIAEWRASADFASLSKASRRNYDAYCATILEHFGDLPIGALDDPAVRAEFRAWRDGMRDQPRKADYAITTLARVLAFAVDGGRIRNNYAARMGRLYVSDRAAKVWSEADVSAFLAKASEPLRLAMALALATGQRQGDLLRLTWGAYDGRAIRVEIGKSRRRGRPAERVTVPLLPDVRAALDAKPRNSTHILTSTDGRPWSSDGFRASWRRTQERAIPGVDLNFNDLRGTAITRLKIAGCSDTEIAAITGHSEKTVGAVLKAHYLGDRAALAETAINRLAQNERGRKL